MSQQKQTRKGTDKFKNAMRSGSKRPSPAAAFMHTETEQENVSEKQTSETTKDNDSVKRNSFPEQETISINSPSQTEQVNVSQKQNNDTETTNKTMNPLPESKELNRSNKGKPKQEHENEPVPAFRDEGSDDFWNIIENEKKKKTVEETHTRQTYLIRNDILNRLQKHSKKQGKGFKTKVINYALEQFLDQIEK